MIILIQILYALFTIGMAKYHSVLIKRNEKINHTLWAIISVVVAAIPLIWFNWLVTVSLIVLRLPVFNTALNAFRGLPIFYVGKGKGASVLDRLWNQYYPAIFITSIALFAAIELMIFR